jgi:hypothetical protein
LTSLTNPTVINIQDTGGDFSYSTVSGGPQLAIDVVTGNIDISTSNTGSYDIQYETDGVCPQQSLLNLVIDPAPNANFSFDDVCLSLTPVMPGDLIAPNYTQDDLGNNFISTGSGGIFSAQPAGLSINQNTGKIDVFNSLPGTYIVTNEILFDPVTGCLATIETDDITIYDLPTATINSNITICPQDVTPAIEVIGTGNIQAPNTVETFTLLYEYNGV